MIKHFRQLTMTNFPAIETELREVQQRATELQKKAKRLTDQVDQIIRKKSTGNTQTSRDVNQHLEEENRQELRQLLELQANIGLDISKGEKSRTESRPGGENETTPSDDSETEKKYLELIDLLTVKMFENQPEPETNLGKTRQSKKSNSLPRTLDVSLQSGLQKSSSQHFSEFSGSGLTAYERLFGKPRPGEG